jgi:phage terminase large subunit
MKTNKTLKVNYKIWEGMQKPQPIIVFIGGRGSGKSLGVGDVLTFEMEARGFDVYCLREFQDSLGDSVHKVFKGSINDRLGLDGWEVQENTVIAPNGAKTTYKGANRNPDAMQSAQGYLRSWFEESHRASQASLDKLIPTIIRNPGAKCIFTANPQSSGDPFSQRFIVPYQEQLEKDGFYEDELHYICVVNWRDNPWWNDEQEQLRKWDFENQTRAKYDWIWEGKFLDTVDDAIILAEWFDACIDAHLKLGFKARGKKVVAHDPSDTGGDAKGYAYRHGMVFFDVCTKETGDVNAGLDWATDRAINHEAEVFTWDCDGLGAALRKDISKNFTGKNIDQVTFKGSHGVDNPDSTYEPTIDNAAQPVKNKELFKNKRAQYYWNLRDRVYKTFRAVTLDEYIDPDELISFSSGIKQIQQLRSEVCRIPRKWNGAGVIQIVSKPEMKTMGIQSPNMSDSIMMALAVSDRIKVKKRPQPTRMPIV